MHPIARYRKKHNLTQKEFASKLGVHDKYLALIEIFKKHPSPKLAKKIEEVTNGEVSRLEVLYPNDHPVAVGE